MITILSDGKLASANVSLTCVALDFIETFHIIEYRIYHSGHQVNRIDTHLSAEFIEKIYCLMMGIFFRFVKNIEFFFCLLKW